MGAETCPPNPQGNGENRTEPNVSRHLNCSSLLGRNEMPCSCSHRPSRHINTRRTPHPLRSYNHTTKTTSLSRYSGWLGHNYRHDKSHEKREERRERREGGEAVIPKLVHRHRTRNGLFFFNVFFLGSYFPCSFWTLFYYPFPCKTHVSLLSFRHRQLHSLCSLILFYCLCLLPTYSSLVIPPPDCSCKQRLLRP